MTEIWAEVWKGTNGKCSVTYVPLALNDSASSDCKVDRSMSSHAVEATGYVVFSAETGTCSFQSTNVSSE